MTTDRPIYNRRTGTIAIPQLLIGMVACWPFIWNTWNSFRFTSRIGGTWAPLALLWALTIAILLSTRRIRVGNLSVWFLFIFASCFSIHRASMTDLVKDLSVVLCGALIILAIPYMKWDLDRVLKIIYTIGLIVALCLIIDNVTGLFRTTLIGLYTDTVREHKLRSATGGGIFSNPAMAGCYIVSGLAAYITHLKNSRKKRTVLEWAIIILFAVSFVLMRKRGFLISAVTAILIIWVLRQFARRNASLTVQRIIRRIATIVLALMVGVLLYNRFNLFRNALDGFVGKLFSEDDTYSGRTSLYFLALRLFSESPLIGIGWGNYRTFTMGIFHSFSVNTFDAHNVYLQLLCETGIVGLLTYLASVMISLFRSIKMRRYISEQSTVSENLCDFALFLQLFYILYSISGNPLYDYQFLITYFVGVAISLKTATND